MKVSFLLLLVGVVLAKHEQYEGWKSYFVLPQTPDQLKIIQSLQGEIDIFVQPSVMKEGVVIVKPELQAEFIKILDNSKILYRAHSENVVETLRRDDAMIEERARDIQARNARNFPYDNYQRLAVFDRYFQDIATRFPEKVILVSPANSFQGRPIYYLKISTTNFEDRSKPVIFIDAGMHSREWITPPTVTWAIHKLTKNITEPDLLERFDWILLPIANPDGYEFSHTNNRFWRKTRSTIPPPLSATCPGVDGNRNFDFAWNTVGTSSSPCSDNFPGNFPFSEIETRVVRDIIDEHLSRMAMYITVHSFGSMVLYPWGNDGSLSHNALGLHLVGVAMANAIDAVSLPTFPRYIVGNAALVLNYNASGAAEDYAHLVGVPLAYTYELPGLDPGYLGFVLPPQYIEQVCRETWEGFVAGARRPGELFLIP